MECRRCGRINADNTVFCEDCGAKLIDMPPTNPICPKCKMKNDAISQFCSKCGTPLRAAAAQSYRQSSYMQSGQSMGVSVDTNKLIWKIVCLVIGLVGMGIGIFIIYSEVNSLFGYSFTPPYTKYELRIMALVVISFVIFIVGCRISTSTYTRY